MQLINAGGALAGLGKLNGIYANASCGTNTAKKAKFHGEPTESFVTGMQQSNKGNPSEKVKEIMDKARRGQKLSAEELDYLAEHSPENYQKVRQAMMEREMLKKELAAAKSKADAERVYAEHLSAVAKSGDELALGQMQGGAVEYKQTAEYQAKPLMTEPEKKGEDDEEKKKKQVSKPYHPVRELLGMQVDYSR